MTITYNAGTNIITVTGYTEATPCNFTDVYNADVAGSWGKVTRQCTRQFCFDCSLQIGDGSTTTWFADLNKQVYFKSFDILWEGSTYFCAVLIKANATFRIGEIQDATNKISKNGCTLTFYSTSISNLYASLFANGSGNISSYGSSIYGINIRYQFGSHPNISHTGNIIYWNSKIDTWLYFYTPNTDVSRLEVTNYRVAGFFGTFFKNLTETIYNYSYFGTRQAVMYVYGGVMTFRNFYGRDNTRISWCSTNGRVHFIDADTDTWDVGWSGTTNNKMYREYSFNLKVIDKDNVAINGATVKVWDKNNNLVVNKTTDVNGVITESILIYGTKTAPSNTFVLETPHLIKIEKAEYTMYEADFTLEDKADWIIALQTSLLRNPSMGGGMV